MNQSPQKTELVKMHIMHSSENDLPLMDEEDLIGHPGHELQSNQQFIQQEILSEHNGDENPQQFLKGIQKYYRKDGDYFVTGVTPGDASKQADDEHQLRLKESEGIYKQGTLAGVFFPVMQNILGVLLFIRVPAITGESGIRDSSLIVFICVLTTFLTSLSLSAIATNGKIKSGGSYYIISRSLGAPIGTALGTCFYLGNTLAGAMYILGAVEAFITTSGVVIGPDELNMRIQGTILCIILVSINYVGIKYVAKFGIPVLMCVLLSILAMYVGIFLQTEDNANLANPDIGLSGISGLSFDQCTLNNDPMYVKNEFFVLLSIYFPSVTGIMAGSNRSGDLQDPSKNIPTGTLGAQILTSIIYLSFPILFGCVCDRVTLQRKDVLIAAQVAWPSHWLVAVGIILSSTGAGLQSLASAPKLMIAITGDDNLPCLRLLKGKDGRIVLMSGFICFCAIMIGEINDINPIITMFFLLCYAGVNSCCVFMDLLSFPNWRPSFRFYHPFTSFLAVCLCFFLMIAISWWAFLVATGLAAILFIIVIKNKNPNSHYGDSISAVKLKLARSQILGLQESQKHVKNYIPIVLVIGDVEDETVGGLGIILSYAQTQLGALHFLRTIRDDTCLSIYGSVVLSNYTKEDVESCQQIEKQVNNVITENNFLVVPQIIQASNKKEGNIFLMQGAGLGSVEPNLIVMPFPSFNYKDNHQRGKEYVDVISAAALFKKAVLIAKPDSAFINNYINEGTIDLWSFSYERGLMILLTFFLSRSRFWKKCSVRLYIVIIEPDNFSDRKKEEDKVKDQIITFLQRYRLNIISAENVFVEFLKPQDIQHFVVQDYTSQVQKLKPLDTVKVIKDTDILIEKNEFTIENYTNHTEGIQQSNNIKYKRAVKELSVLTSNQTENINKIICNYSQQADLVITNLPDPMAQTPSEYLDFLKLLTNNLKRVILIRNEFQNVITEFT